MRRPAPVALALVGGIALWLAWCAAAGLLQREAWAPESLGTYVYRADFWQGQQGALSRAAEAWGWQPGPNGLAVPGGSQAVLRYAFDAEQPAGYARLEVQAQMSGAIDLAVEARSPEGLATLFCADGTMGGSAHCSRLSGGNLPALGRRVLSLFTGSIPGSMDLSPLTRSQGAVEIIIRARNRDSEPAPVLQGLTLTLAAPFFAPQAAALLFWVPVPALLVAGALWATASLQRVLGARDAARTGSAGVPPASAGGRAGTPAPPGGRPRLSLLASALAFWITVWALLNRLDALVTMGSGGLEPDARGYLGAARSLGLLDLYAPLEREPLFPYLARLWQLLLGPGEVALRMLTIAASTAAVAMVYVLGRRLIGTVPVLVASAVMAVHPFFVWNATRGLREDVGLALLLALLAVLLARKRPTVTRAGAAGALTGALLLLRMDMLPVSLLALGFTALAQRWPPRAWATALSLAALLFAPFLWVQWRAHGDPMYPASLQARAFRNYEFHDLPGFPTRADMDRDQFLAGPPISWLGYYFGLHTPQDLATTTALGSVRVLQSVAINTLPGTPEAPRWALIALLVLGAAVAAFRRYRVLALVGTVLLLQFAFLHVKAYRYSQVDAYGGVDPRLFMSGFPFLLLCAAGLLSLAPLVPSRWRQADGCSTATS